MPTINCTSCIYPRVMKKAGFDTNGNQRYQCPSCKTTTLGRSRVVSAWQTAPIRKPDKYDAAATLFRQGFSYRYVAREVGIANVTSFKYKKLALIGQSILCACGKPSGHNGWCEWRVGLSPARQAYYAKCAAQSAISLARVRPPLEPFLTTWPFVRSFDNDDYALLKAVNEIVPRNIPEHVRADVCQDILMDIVSGSASLESIPHRMKEYTRKAYGFIPSKFGPKSLDSFIFGDEGRTLGETLEG